MNFSLFIIPIILTILFETLFKCFFQVRFLSMITPKKLKLSTHSICIPFILTIGNLICFCGFLNIMNFDLAEFSDNLLSTKCLFLLILYSICYFR